MNYYQELTVIKSPDISPYFIWSKLYTQVHLALVEQAKVSYGEDAKQGDIGVSFPEYRHMEKNGKTITQLGTKLRIFGKTQVELEQLNLTKWLERLSDYVHIKSIDNVKAKQNCYLIVKRLRQEKNMDRKTLQFAKKYDKPFEEVKQARITHIMQRDKVDRIEAEKRYNNPNLKERPYIIIKSLENHHSFSLEIDQRQVETACDGTFNTYGLSGQSTVPHW